MGREGGEGERREGRWGGREEEGERRREKGGGRKEEEKSEQ